MYRTKLPLLLTRISSRCVNYSDTQPKHGMKQAKGHRRKGKKLPLDWRKVNHNPAKLPYAWKPPNWDKENVIDHEYEKILAEYIPGYQPTLDPTEHPDYKQEPAYEMSCDTKLFEGLDHALSITKSILVDTKLPKQIHELAQNNLIVDQDRKVCDVFRHGLMFDIHPRTINQAKDARQDPTYDNFKLYSTPDRYVPLIMLNMRMLCQELIVKYPKMLDTMPAENIDMNIFFTRSCDSIDFGDDKYNSEKKWNILLSGNPGIQLLKKEKLKPFANTEEVANSKDINVGTIYPITPIVDLKETNIYKNDVAINLSQETTYKHFHTLLLNNLDEFTTAEMYGRMAMYLFGALYARALRHHGRNVDVLDEPLAGQCIASNGQTYQFMAMQLNTMNLKTDFGVKNMVWIESPKEVSEIQYVPIMHRSMPFEEERKYRQPEHIRRFTAQRPEKYTGIPMFSACSHRLWKNPGYYSDYDERVFPLFLGMMINGNY